MDQRSLRSFIYLDEYKLSSLSSQLFGGVTNALVVSNGRGAQDREEQKGPVGSGRVLSDSSFSLAERVEHRVLLDHAYTEFEERLVDDGRVSIIAEGGYDPRRPFIKVSGRAMLTDIEAIANTLKSFNEMGLAISYVSSFEDRESAVKALDVQLSQVKDKNEKARLKRSIQKLSDPKRIAQEAGLGMDQKFLENLAYVLEFGYSDQLEVQIRSDESGVSERAYTAHLQRSWLRENEDLLIKKYSRSTEKVFTVVGIVAQEFGTGYSPDSDTDEIAEDSGGSSPGGPDPDGLRHAIRNMALSLSGIEQTFSGKYSSEMILDPIAVYREL